MIKNFKGYNVFELETTIKEIWHDKDFTFLLLEETPFFAESAGQVSDDGLLFINGSEHKVISLSFLNDEVVHKIAFQPDLKIGNPIKAAIDKLKRNDISQNHTGAHLLYDTLKENYLNSYSNGYFNDQNNLRLDMYVEQKLTNQDIERIQKLINEKIQNDAPKEEIILNEQDLKGNYYDVWLTIGDRVLEGDLRIVKFKNISKQLCSGTHIDNLNLIEGFFIYNYELKGNNTYRFYANTKISKIENSIQEAISKEKEELTSLITKYTDNSMILTNEEIATDINFIKSEVINKDNFYLWKEKVANLKVNIKNYLVNVDKIKKEKLMSQYENPNFINGRLEIINNDLEIKDMQFLADYLIKDLKNSMIEIINMDKKLYFVRTTGEVSAIEIMKANKEFKIKGGGNQNIAQGKII